MTSHLQGKNFSTSAVSPFTGNSPTDSEDAAWVLTCTFIIFTMQSGFGLVEAGMCSKKNETNIMVKNAIDAIFGGLGYWVFGYGFSVGRSQTNNGFSGREYFLLDPANGEMGEVFSKYIFQLSFATTSATIVSGALAERVTLKAYMVFAFFNTLSYSFPAHWIWTKSGFLNALGVVDIAGCSAVNIAGGTSALVVSVLIKPRQGRFIPNVKHKMGSPTNMLLGMFMLWWGWLGFNCGSTFGISGNKWKLASRAAVTTINAVIGGSCFGIFFNLLPQRLKSNRFELCNLLYGSLGGLVSITAICAVCRPWEALLIGLIGGAIAVLGNRAIVALKIDDPVGCVGVHLFSGVWGMIAVGFFVEVDNLVGVSPRIGLFKGGGWYLIGVQVVAIAAVLAWSAVISACLYFAIDKILGFRVSLRDELLGADWSEHGIGKFGIASSEEGKKTAPDSGHSLTRRWRRISINEFYEYSSYTTRKEECATCSKDTCSNCKCEMSVHSLQGQCKQDDP